jgi:hypothetical protein
MTYAIIWAEWEGHAGRGEPDEIISVGLIDFQPSRIAEAEARVLRRGARQPMR